MREETNTRQYKGSVYIIFGLYCLYLLLNFITYIWSPSDGFSQAGFYLKNDHVAIYTYFIVLLTTLGAFIPLYLKKDKITLAILLLVSLLFLLIGVGSSSKDNISFSVSNNDILSWEEIESGFSISITKDKEQDLFRLTSNNLGAQFDFYINNELISSPTIRQPLAGQSFMLAADKQGKEKIKNLLPIEKRH